MYRLSNKHTAGTHSRELAAAFAEEVRRHEPVEVTLSRRTEGDYGRAANQSSRPSVPSSAETKGKPSRPPDPDAAAKKAHADLMATRCARAGG